MTLDTVYFLKGKSTEVKNGWDYYKRK
jgi:hypothetical protein